MASARIQVSLAVIAVVGSLGAALFANWDKVFGEEKPQPLPYEQTISDLKLSVKEQELKLSGLEEKLKQANQELSEKKNQLIQKDREIEALKIPFHRIENTKLKQLLSFHNDASCYGRSLNFTHPAGEAYKNCVPKEVLAKSFLEFLEELEMVKGNGGMDYSRARAKRELINLQNRYNFTTTGWYTDYTLGILIIEYAKRS